MPALSEKDLKELGVQHLLQRKKLSGNAEAESPLQAATMLFYTYKGVSACHFIECAGADHLGERLPARSLAAPVLEPNRLRQGFNLERNAAAEFGPHGWHRTVRPWQAEARPVPALTATHGEPRRPLRPAQWGSMPAPVQADRQTCQAVKRSIMQPSQATRPCLLSTLSLRGSGVQ